MTNRKNSMNPVRPSTCERPTDDGPRDEKSTSGTAAGDAVFVSEVIGEGDAARRLVRVGAWEFTVPGADGTELEIPDAALAPRLGMTLHHLRELSGRHEREGNISPRVYRTVRETGGRPGKQRFYSEADALFLVTRSERPEAIALTKEMIAVYMLARRGLLTPKSAPAFDEAAVARMIDEAFRARLAAMPPSHDGPVLHNDDRAVVLDPILTLAKRSAGGDATKRDVARMRGRIEHRVRDAVKWTSRWCLLPRVQTGAVCAALARESAIADQFAEAIAKNRQGSLRLVSVKPVAK